MGFGAWLICFCLSIYWLYKRYAGIPGITKKPHRSLKRGVHSIVCLLLLIYDKLQVINILQWLVVLFRKLYNFLSTHYLAHFLCGNQASRVRKKPGQSKSLPLEKGDVWWHMNFLSRSKLIYYNIDLLLFTPEIRIDIFKLL